MREGLLWYDNDSKKALATKVAEAAQAYQRKFGWRPDTCYVALETVSEDTNGTGLRPVPFYLPSGTAAASQKGTGLRLVPSTLVRPYHFWVGLDQQPVPA